MGTTGRKGARRYGSVRDWPAWTDEFSYADGPAYQPSDEDLAWAAGELGQGHDDRPLPDEVLDELAAEATAAEALERGLPHF